MVLFSRQRSTPHYQHYKESQAESPSTKDKTHCVRSPLRPGGLCFLYLSTAVMKGFFPMDKALGLLDTGI